MILTRVFWRIWILEFKECKTRIVGLMSGLKKRWTYSPLISIIVPVYNVEEYIDACMESIVCQYYDNLQIIIVDDGSTDHSGELCDHWASNDSRIEVIHEANAGLSAARNRGINYVKGDYIMFVDSDDSIGRNHVGNMLSAIESFHDKRQPLVITGYTASPLQCNAHDAKELIPNDERIITAEEALTTSVSIGGEFGSHAWGKLFPKNLFRYLKFPIGKCFEDQFIMHEVFISAEMIIYQNANDYYYTTGRSQSISNVSKLNHLDYLEAIHQASRYVKDACPGAYEAVSARYYRALVDSCTIAAEFGEFELMGSILSEMNQVRKKAISNACLEDDIKCKMKVLAFGKPIATGYYRAIGYRRRMRNRSLRMRVAGVASWQLERARVFKEYKSVCNKTKKKRVFFLMTPLYKNYGDHLIAYSEALILNSICDSREIIEVPCEDCMALRKRFGKLVRAGDVVIITGGGYAGDLWPGMEEAFEDLLSGMRSDTQVVILPQSIYYENMVFSDTKLCKLINRFSRCILMCRERRTFEYVMDGVGNNIQVYLYPDMGLFVSSKMLGYTPKQQIGNTASVCMRKDCESLQSPTLIHQINDSLISRGLGISSIDTHDPCGVIWPNERKRELCKLVQRFGSSSIVLTNRLHGMILAVIAGTPCVVFDNVSGKVSGVAEWLGADYPVFVCDESTYDLAIDRALSARRRNSCISSRILAEKCELLNKLSELVELS